MSVPVLLVVVGAGASTDSVDPQMVPWVKPPPGEADYQPPLTRDLFAPRQNFGAVIDRLPSACKAIIGRLRTAVVRGENLEAALEQIKQDSERDGILHGQLIALRFYLQAILWTCGDIWGRNANGITNYCRIVESLRAWQAKEQKHIEINFVTFNYDTMLERALTDVLGLTFNEMSGYVSNNRWKLFKVHGSVNWARALTSIDPTQDPYQVVEWLVETGKDVSDSLPNNENWMVVSNPGPLAGLSAVLPAIGIPVQKKEFSNFECPLSQIELLQRQLARVCGILTLGWRGQEEHFAQIVHGKVEFSTPWCAVGNTSTNEVIGNLKSGWGLTATPTSVTGGLSSFLATDGLDEFLSTLPLS